MASYVFVRKEGDELSVLTQEDINNGDSNYRWLLDEPEPGKRVLWAKYYREGTWEYWTTVTNHWIAAEPPDDVRVLALLAGV